MGDPGPSSSSSDPHPDYAEVILVRHGPTEWNPDIMLGQLDVELNADGIDQALAVAESISRERKVSVIYSSDLKRAYETAEIIANKCGLDEIMMYPGLRERHIGILEAMSRREASKANPAAYEAMNRGQEIPGGGESVDALFERCTSALQEIGMKHLGTSVVVVTHADVMRQLCKRINTDSPCVSLMNKGIVVFRLYEDKWVV